jgi:hypothetical protein
MLLLISYQITLLNLLGGNNLNNKYVISMHDVDTNRYAFHMETEHAKQYMCSAGILEATVYTGLEGAEKVLAETVSLGQYKIIPYHQGLSIAIDQESKLIQTLESTEASSFVSWTKEEAIEYYRGELSSMKKLYNKEINNVHKKDTRN